MSNVKVNEIIETEKNWLIKVCLIINLNTKRYNENKVIIHVIKICILEKLDLNLNNFLKCVFVIYL